jgi:hypothetical protein
MDKVSSGEVMPDPQDKRGVGQAARSRPDYDIAGALREIGASPAWGPGHPGYDALQAWRLKHRGGRPPKK